MKNSLQLPGTLTIRKCVILMTLSLISFSVIIPLIDSYIHSSDLNVIESQIQLNQSEIRNSQAIYFAHFANFILCFDDFKHNQKLKMLWDQSHTSSLDNMLARVGLLYIFIHDEYPSDSILSHWNALDFNQLEDEIISQEFLANNWKENLELKITILEIIRYIICFLAVFAYFIGTLGIIFKDHGYVTKKSYSALRPKHHWNSNRRRRG